MTNKLAYKVGKSNIYLYILFIHFHYMIYIMIIYKEKINHGRLKNIYVYMYICYLLLFLI